MARHELSQRLCQPWEHARQAHTNITLINEFFNVLKMAIAKCETSSDEPLNADDIFNLDETGFDRNIAMNRMVCKKAFGKSMQSIIW